ncbi:putative lipoprotein, partial [Reticulomyxa filosa]
PHLTFQEWFAAYYLVHCLYQPTESDDHKQVCSILINEQLNPKYSMIIPFMAGILYDYIENGKDPDGSRLLYFWKLLHAPSICQLSPIYQIILSMRCLDSCKADTESQFLPSQLRNCHKNLIDLFKSFLIAWINFDIHENDNKYRTAHLPLHKVIGLNFSNLSHVLVHPDIYSCIIDQFKPVPKQLNQREYLIIPKKQNRITRWFRPSSQCNVMLMDTLEAIALKVSEIQLSDVIETLLGGICDRDSHGKCARFIEKISRNMNKEQLYNTFRWLMDIFNKKYIPLDEYADIFAEEYIPLDVYADIFEAIATKLDEKQVDIFDILLGGFQKRIDLHEICAKLIEKILLNMNTEQLSSAFKRMIDTFNNKSIHLCDSCARVITTFVIKLDKEQMDYILKYVISEFETKDKDIFNSCAVVLETIVMKLDVKQLSSICKSFLNALDSTNESYHRSSADLLKRILLILNEKQQNNVFRHLIDGLQDKRKFVHQYCVQLIRTLLKKWNQEQSSVNFKNLLKKLINNNDKSGYWLRRKLYMEILVDSNEIHLDTAFKYLIKGLKCKKKRIHKLCIDLLATLSKKWNPIQLDNFVMYLIKNSFKYKNNYVRYLCAQTIQKLKLNEKQLSNDVVNYLMNGFKNDPSKNVQYSCAESIGKISMKLNKKQLNIAWKCSKNRLNDKNKDMLVRISCAEFLGRIAMKLNKQQLDNTLECLMNGINDDNENTFVQKYCVYSFERVLLKLHKRGVNELTHKLSIQSLEMVIKHKEKQFDNIISCLIDGLKNRDKVIYHHYIKSLTNLLTKLNKKQLDAKNLLRLNETRLNNLLQWLIKIYKDNLQLQDSCLKILTTISPVLTDQQLDSIIQFLKSGFSNTDYNIGYSCEKILQIISKNLSKQQVNDIFEFLLNKLNNKYHNLRASCAKGLEMIELRLNETQLNNLLQCLIKGYKDNDNQLQDSCLKIFTTISPVLTDQQLDNIIQFLKSGFSSSDYNIRYSCEKILQIISKNLNLIFVLHVRKDLK